MAIITPNAKNELNATDKRARIMEALKETRCPMTADQIREWLRDRRLGTMTAQTVTGQLKIMEKEGKATHPQPEQTLAWTYVRGAR